MHSGLALDAIALLTLGCQVIPGHGNPRKGGQCLAVMYSNIIAINARLD